MRRGHETIESTEGGQGGGGWGSPPGGGGWGTPPAGPGGGGGEAPPPGIGPGGGAPPFGDPPPRAKDDVEVGAIFEGFQLLLARARPGLFGALGTLLGVAALLQLPQWVIGVIGAASPDAALATLPVSVCVGCIGGIGSFAIGVVLTGLLRVARRLLLEGPGAAQPVGPTLREATRDWISLALASLVYGVAVAVGMVLCIIPGLVAAFFLAFVPYLVSTQGLDIGASLTRSVELAQKHVVPLLIAVAIYVVVALGVIAAIAVLTFIANAALGPAAGAAFTSPVSFLISTIASYVGWLFFASALVTIDAAESGTEIVRD